MSHDFDRDWWEADEGAAGLVPGFAGAGERDRGPEPAVHPGAAQFDVVLRGYDRHQVDEHLDEVAALVARMREQVEEAARREAAANERAAKAHAELERGRPGFDTLGERVGQMLALAEAEAAELREQAGSEAARLREDAQRETVALRAEAESDASRLRAEAQREADELVARAQEEARRLREQAAREAEQMQEEARGELDWLEQERLTVLEDLSTMRDTLSGILSRAAAPRPPR